MPTDDTFLTSPHALLDVLFDDDCGFDDQGGNCDCDDDDDISEIIEEYDGGTLTPKATRNVAQAGA